MVKTLSQTTLSLTYEGEKLKEKFGARIKNCSISHILILFIGKWTFFYGHPQFVLLLRLSTNSLLSSCPSCPGPVLAGYKHVCLSNNQQTLNEGTNIDWNFPSIQIVLEMIYMNNICFNILKYNLQNQCYNYKFIIITCILLFPSCQVWWGYPSDGLFFYHHCTMWSLLL